MKAATAYDTQCPVARALDSVGQWWNILILREAMYGLTRFDEFEKSLQIAPTMLTRRLKSLVEVGVLERRQYSERPARYEYILTDAGRDFRSVIVTLYAWSNRHLAPEGAAVVLIDAKSGELADPMLVATGIQIVRAIGIKRLIPLLAVGGLALGFLATRGPSSDEAPAE